ncbi:MAG: glycosyltransferase family 2 protein [Bacteroidales bacterium]|nr:glycosyltransferase family 2 protein [Bacteroidales bacterium]
MNIFLLLLDAIQIVILIYLGICLLYLFVFAVAGLFKNKIKPPADTKIRRIAVLIPGYKEDNVIIHVAEHATKQNYPNERFDVVIIADSYQKETLDELRKLPVILIEVSFEISTKAKALNKAFEQLSNDYDIAIILDADNLMEKDFLHQMNSAFSHNIKAVQGHRMAKNMNTPFAILDSVSEEINNHIFRKGHINLGLSSAIIGSGVGFDYTFFKNLISDIGAVGGFDKEIELKMLRDGYFIDYLHNAYVLDEKVQKSEVFSNQRRRWLSAQFVYLRKFFITSLIHLITKGNIEFFNKAFQFAQLPRILILGLVYILSPLFIWYNFVQNQNFTLWAWILVFTITTLTFVFSVPRKFYNLKTLKALLFLPRGIILMALSLMKIKGANKKFIHTSHGPTS